MVSNYARFKWRIDGEYAFLFAYDEWCERLNTFSNATASSVARIWLHTTQIPNQLNIEYVSVAFIVVIYLVERGLRRWAYAREWVWVSRWRESVVVQANRCRHKSRAKPNAMRDCKMFDCSEFVARTYRILISILHLWPHRNLATISSGDEAAVTCVCVCVFVCGRERAKRWVMTWGRARVRARWALMLWPTWVCRMGGSQQRDVHNSTLCLCGDCAPHADGRWGGLANEPYNKYYSPLHPQVHIGHPEHTTHAHTHSSSIHGMFTTSLYGWEAALLQRLPNRSVVW